MKTYNYEEICDIIKNEIALRSGIGAEKITLEKSLEEYALDSINVVRLAATLEENLNVDIEPTLMYEYENLQKMAKQFEVLHKKNNIKKSQESKTEITIHITASFTAEPVEEILTYCFEKLMYRPLLSFAGYNQTFQELLNSQSSLFRSNDTNIMLVRIEDWFRFSKSVTSKKVIETVDEFTAALENAAQHLGFKLILGLCPHSSSHIRKLGISNILEHLDQKILGIADKCKNIQILDFRKLDKSYEIGRVYDEARDQLGHIPFTQNYFAAMAIELSKKIFLSLQQPHKVIVLDCDNTLWSGVCGEDGYDGVEISKPFQELQEFMIEQMQSGKILCIASKNREQDVQEVFEKNSNMILQEKHIVTSRVNWQPKSQNIKQMSEELQLGLNSFIFIDDNPAECAEVKSTLPQVCVLHIPKNSSKIMSTVRHFWPLELATAATTEDKKRTQMYIENKQRKDLEENVVRFDDFLEQLQVEINIEPLVEKKLPRAAQLTQRTNQFNATTIRRSESDIYNLLQNSRFEVFSVDVKDKFGDYGFVGLMVCEIQEKDVICETFLMSCRVLGRKVETTMLQELAKFARKNECTHLCLDFVPSERNEPLYNFYSSLDSSLSLQGEKQQIVIDINKINEIIQKAKMQRSVDNKRKLQNSTVAAQGFSEGLQEIANFRGDITKILGSVTSVSKIKRPSISTPFVTPRTSWQKKLATIWCDVLRMDKVGIYDNFYELGGDSLRAAEVFAKMWDLGVSDSISLQTIPKPTIAGLAQAIDDVKNGKKPSLLMDTFSLEDEAKVPEDIMGQPCNFKNLTMKNVFITGATGYIGAFLISELFIQSTVNVICLVRAATKEDGIDRVRSNLERYSLWKEKYSSRLDVVLGDLTEPLFGLSLEEFSDIGRRIDTIFHSGAWVNFVYPYQYLEKANVFSVETILRLTTSQSHPIQLHFISTLGVIMSTGYPRGNLVYETEELAHSEDLLNGYEQSKFVGDKMVWLAMKERQIPASMYRPGMVSGLSESGTYHKLDEFLPCFLKGCIQMGSWPLLDTTWEIVPIDYLAKAIIHIALNPNSLGKAYFSLHPNPRPVVDFVKWHQDAGFNIRGLPWDVWKKELLSQKGEALRQNALFPFVDFIRALSEKQVYFPPTDKTQFLDGIAGSGIECPDQLVLMERYTDYFIKQGYYQGQERFTNV
ncbi:thioester reductase domain-containing protein [Candidatus Uabimicrobium sp. HlEnr_7]|uniref:thioester reductase domain-containing protein n=1 Tax=Candidatus Uabimicrobium helgolandensis TaxID=3095367 RepID=UPI00355791CC